MFNPLRRLKSLPWIPLLQVAFVTVLIVNLFDVLLIGGAAVVPGIRELLQLIFLSNLGGITSLVISAAIGVLGVTVMETWFRQIYITTGVIWALLPCILLWLLLIALLRSTSSFPSLAVPGVDVTTLVLLALGAFWKGRKYSRW